MATPLDLPLDPLALGDDILAGSLDLDTLLGEGPLAPLPTAPSAGSRGGRRIDESLLSAEEKAKLEKERAKNRRAAAKYKAKQKEKQAGLETQHAAAAAELEQHQARHEALRRENAVLEGLLAVKDSAVAALETAKAEECAVLATPSSAAQAGAGAAGSSPLLLGAAGSGGMGSGWGSSSEATSGAAAAGAAASAGGGSSRAAGLGVQLLRQGSSGADSRQGSGSLWSGEGGDASAASLPVLPYHYGWDEGATTDPQELLESVDPLVIAEVQCWTPEECIRDWREYAREARDLLQVYDVTRSQDLLLSRLRPMMEEQSRKMNLALRHNPDCFWALLASSREHGLTEEQQREKWDGVVAAMNITPAQHRRYLELCAEYEALVDQARAERARAVAAISQAAATGPEAPAGGRADAFLQLRQEAAALSGYARQEFLAVLQLLVGMGSFNPPLQRVRAAAMSYPHFPDILAMVAAFKRLPVPPDAGSGGPGEAGQ